MGRAKEPELPVSNPTESKKHRDESVGHLQNGYYERALASLHKEVLCANEWQEGAKTHSVTIATTAGASIQAPLPTPGGYVTSLIASIGDPVAMESEKNVRDQAHSIFGLTKDAEFLQSFVRVGVAEEEEDSSPTPKASISKRAPQSAEKRNDEDGKYAAKDHKESVKPRKKRDRKQKREKRRREEEVYTDKDRAAAVVMGSKDIKQSLNIKDKAERSSALQLPIEADAGTLLALARAEMMRERYRTAVLFVDKAIELAPEEKAAYVARSRCYLLLGEPRLALADAETALKMDPKHAKALLQKAEALYYCGEFEMSLVYYHRGLRARPDLIEFRLGVQKAQEAIENTIGEKPVKKPPPKRSSSKSQKPVLGQLMSDKLYLENLLKNPDLAIADKKNDVITKQAEEAIRFLENREEFWRQQQS